MNRHLRNVLVNNAKKARDASYSPYSHFQVGAALMTDHEEIYTGCNIENAAYSPTNCAERTAFFKAVSEGHRKFQAIAIVGAKEGSIYPFEPCPPCGVCRQVMMEFCDPETFEVILVKDDRNYTSYKLKELLPMGFKL